MTWLSGEDEGLVGSSALFEDAEAALAALAARLPGFVPEWRPAELGDWSRAEGAGAALAQIAARYLEVIRQRYGYAPGKAELALLSTWGARLAPPRPARAAVTFRLQEKAADARVPAGTRLSAPPAPGQTLPVAFETETTLRVAAARLREVFSFWPGRDQYIDHSADLAAGSSIHPFRLAELLDAPHELYLGHQTLLALSGKSTLIVGVELATPGDSPLHLLWEYWDGQVWRGFKDVTPTCGESAALLDGTLGLTRNGQVKLVTDFAETADTVVFGITTRWARARLADPLPLGSATTVPQNQRGGPTPAAARNVATRVLPEIDVIELSVQIERSLPEPPIDTTPSKSLDLSDVKAVPDKGLPLDKAFADQLPLDVTKTFFPFGQQPQPGSAFYWKLEDALSKPGALATLELTPAVTPQQQGIINLPVVDDATKPLKRTKTPLDATVVWEYWDGRQWSELALEASSRPLKGAIWTPIKDNPGTEPFFVDTTTNPASVTVTRIKFSIPKDAAPIKINGDLGRWVRVRLDSGGFGIVYEVETTATPVQTSTSIIPAPPALADARLGYVWQNGPFPPEHLLTYNDFQHADKTDAAWWEGETVVPFRPPSDSTPALFFGFDKPLPADSVGIYFDVREDPEDDLGPALAWEYWDGFAWSELTAVNDQTRRLRVQGLVTLLGPTDSAELPRFGTPRHWMRARLKDDGPPGAPSLDGVYLNSVSCVQRETIVDDPLGTGDGRPSQTLRFRRVPVLEGEAIEVRESSGLRAQVEWRLLAREVSGGSDDALRALEAQLAREGNLLDFVFGDIRLRRDRFKQVSEVWVRWHGQPHLLESGPGDRHYVVERSRGVVLFGDGDHGKILPAGATVLAKQYQVGGGSLGNQPAKSITQVAGAIAGLEQAFNPKPAEGGADGETVEEARRRGPATIRHRGRALMPADYEALALEASPAVARAWALANRDPNGRDSPSAGSVTIQILPRGSDPLSWPSFGLREEVRAYIAARAPACLVTADRLRVTGPVYFKVDVDATLAPSDPTNAGQMLDDAKTALTRFLHPSLGGPDGGWPPERDLHASDVAVVLERVKGLDHVEVLSLRVNSEPQGEVVHVPAGRVLAAGEIRFKPTSAQPGLKG